MPQSNKNYEISLNAGGTIAPASIVKIDSAADEQCLQASATSDALIGIVGEAMRGTPGLAGSDTTIAYTSGDKVPIVGYGNDCMLKCGAGAGVTAGDLITTDASGFGATAARASGKVVVAIALQTSVASAKFRVLACAPFTA